MRMIHMGCFEQGPMKGDSIQSASLSYQGCMKTHTMNQMFLFFKSPSAPASTKGSKPSTSIWGGSNGWITCLDQCLGSRDNSYIWGWVTCVDHMCGSVSRQQQQRHLIHLSTGCKEPESQSKGLGSGFRIWH